MHCLSGSSLCLWVSMSHCFSGSLIVSLSLGLSLPFHQVALPLCSEFLAMCLFPYCARLARLVHLYHECRMID